MTIVACLTPPGAAAVAVLLLHGPLAWDTARRRFTPRKGPLPDAPEAGRFWLGRVGADDGSPGDEVILVARSADPPAVEIHCHGGPQVVEWLTELFRGDGLTPCGWEQALAALHGDRLKALALAELARAPTARTAAVLLDQANGAYADALARGDVATLRRYAGVGAHLTTPWRVAVAGPPNAGKSSLVNAAAGYQRSVVAPVPGTTRDVVTTVLALDGWPVELADTAGLRDAADELERAGVERAAAAAAAADLVLWVAAPDVPATDPPPGRVLKVWNKRDLAGPPDGTWLAVSAAAGTGVEELLAAVARELVPDPPPPGTAVPFAPELIAAL